MDLPRSGSPSSGNLLVEDMDQIDPAVRHGFAGDVVEVLPRSPAQATNEN